MTDVAVPSLGSPAASLLAVLKIGGSVLTGHAGYAAAASHVAARLRRQPTARFVVVVSAQYGHTDTLDDEAVAIASPDLGPVGTAPPDAGLRDLLWSTGETRSVALLALRLRAIGVNATGLSVHETGLTRGAGADRLDLGASRLHEALDAHDVVVVPGFLAVERQRIVALGRGGSDWSAVALAVSLGADRCELVKDVDGYYTADPATTDAAVLIARLPYHVALQMADDGCPLVQRPAIAEAARARLPLVVRSFSSAGTVVQE